MRAVDESILSITDLYYQYADGSSEALSSAPIISLHSVRSQYQSLYKREPQLTEANASTSHVYKDSGISWCIFKVWIMCS